MARGVAQPGKAAGNDKLRIFISYSRRDAAAADAIVAALNERGFEVKIDTRDLPFGEEWQKELADFIRLSDTVIWLVSEASIRSEWVNWELDEVKARNKRLVPVMVGIVNPAELPRQLGAIHILPPDRVFDLARDLDTLVQVLETDHAWLKQATRWQDRAAEWLAKGRKSALLLSRGALTEAERWKETRPAKAPAPAPEVLDLLLASRQAATRRQRWWIVASLTVALGAFALAGGAMWQWAEAVEQRRVTDAVRKQAQTTESGLLANSAEAVNKLPGNSGAPLAMLLALEGMPDAESNDARQAQRPLVAETQVHLDQSYFANRERKILPHESEVLLVAWSPIGQFVATGSFEYEVRIFDAATGRVVTQLKHGNRVEAAAWSPDGRSLATGSQDKSAQIIDAATGKQLARVMHDDGVIAVAWSPDGRFLATGAEDRMARIVDAASGKVLARIAHEDWVKAIAWSPNGRFLASGSRDKTARIADAATGELLVRVVHEDGVTAVAWSPNGRFLATGSTDKSARVIDAASGKVLARVVHEDEVTAVAWSPNGRFLATGSDDRTARIVDAASGKVLARVVHEDRVTAVAWSPNGRFLATGSTDKMARIVDPATGKELARVAHEHWVTAVAWNPDGRFLATGSDDTTARIIENVLDREIARVAHENSVVAVACSPDGRHFATASNDKSVRILESETGREIARVTQKHEASQVAWSPDGQSLATGAYDKTRRLMAGMATVLRNAELGNAEPASKNAKISTIPGEARLVDLTGRRIAQIEDKQGVYAVAWSPDGRLVAAALDDATVRIIQPATGQEIARLKAEAQVMALEWSPQGRSIALGASDGRAQIAEAATGRELARAVHKGSVDVIAWSPDGKFLATGSRDGTASIVEAETAREYGRIVLENPVVAVKWSPDGQLLATGSGVEERGEARIFSVSARRQLARVAQGAVNAVAWSSDGRMVASGSSDGTVRIIDAAIGKEVARIVHEGEVQAVSWSPAGAAIGQVLLTGTTKNTAHLWRVIPTPQALVKSAKARAARCLTIAQRKQYFLPPTPPTWCVERRLWPYHSDEWHNDWLPKQKAWLASGSQGVAPALPKSE